MITITFEDLQNVSLFIISSYSFSIYCYLNYITTPIITTNNYDYIQYYDNILPIIAVHAFADLFITKKPDLQFHHLLVLSIFYFNYYYNITPEHKYIFIQTLLNTEISSLFLVLKFWLPKKYYIYNFNLGLFYATFFKFRIYNYFYAIVNNLEPFEQLTLNYSVSSEPLYYLFIASCYSLFALNVYWFSILTKILCKKCINLRNG